MKRCVYCCGLIWPWQHYGFRTVSRGRLYWHTRHMKR